MFTKYAAIVKNLRGVVIFNLDEEGVRDKINWLTKRFKYRNLGITPTLLSKYHEFLKEKLKGNPFRELVYPIEAIKDAVKIFSENLNLPIILAEAIAFSSTYISPLIMIGNTFRGEVEANAIEIIKTCKEMNVKSWKLHLRIADYSVLDMYEENVNEALEVIREIKANTINQEKINQIIKDRIARVKNDSKRFWRIKCSEGKPFLYYIDLLAKIAAKTIKKEINVNKLVDEYAASLTIIPVIYIPTI